MTLNGGGGRFARVTAAFPKFSLLEDSADPSRAHGPGEQYSITLVDKSTERPEPSVQLVWLDNA